MAEYKLITTEGRAKRGEFKTVHGTIQTPVFMNVGTIAAIKGAVSTVDLHEIGTQVELSNTYHLHVRPGDKVVKQLGGLHEFMNWDRPILTDSGGFQVFSLAKLRKIKEEGVYFNSHIDGHKIFMGPEQSMQIQSNLASTIAMAFDECPSSVADRDYVQKSVARTTRWLKRCKDEAILDEGLIAPMGVIGDRFSAGEAFVPEMLVAARAMSAGTEVLKPHLAEAGAEPLGKAVIGTVKGDMHDIGKNLVRMMIEGKGFEVTDLGVDVAPEAFVSFLQEHDDVDIVCCSALLTTTMPEIGATIRAIEEAGLRDKVKVMIGGAPVTQAYADEVGADAYTPDAGAAAVKAAELVGA